MFKKILRALWAVVKSLYKVFSYLVFFAFAALGFLIVALLVWFSMHKADLTARKYYKFEGDNAYLYLNLERVSEQSLVEPPYANLARNLGIYIPSGVSVTEIKEMLERASKDDRIKGVFVDTDQYSYETFGINEELHSALLKFKKEGKKPVYGYSVNFGMADLLLLRDADKIFIGTAGGVDLSEMSVNSFFLGDFYKKFGVKDYSYQAGKYGLSNLSSQSAFTDENQPSIDAIVWKPLNLALAEVNQGRGTKVTLKDFSYQTLVSTAYKFESQAEHVTKLGLTDQVVSELQWSDFVRKTAGVNEKTKRPKVVSLGAYLADAEAEQHESKAPMSNNDYYLTYYYNGFLGQSDLRTSDIALDLESLVPPPAEEANPGEGRLRGVVLRLQSGGGSIKDVPVLYEAIYKLRDAGVPVVVSVPDALGGAAYVGALAANGIVADKFASVGAINASNKLLDITDTLRAFYNINPSYIKGSRLVSSGFGSPVLLNFIIPQGGSVAVNKEFVEYRHLTTDSKYNRLVEVLEQSRNMTHEQANNVAQGLVFNALDAKELGLIDRIGGTEEAYALLDFINKNVDKDFNPAIIDHYEGNPIRTGNSALLNVINNEISSYLDYRKRMTLGLSQEAYKGLRMEMEAAKSGEILSICVPCVTAKPNFNNVAPTKVSKLQEVNPLYSVLDYYFK